MTPIGSSQTMLKIVSVLALDFVCVRRLHGNVITLQSIKRLERERGGRQQVGKRSRVETHRRNRQRRSR